MTSPYTHPEGPALALAPAAPELELEPELKVFYFDFVAPTERPVMMDHYVPLEDLVEDELLDYLVEREQGTAMCFGAMPGDDPSPLAKRSYGSYKRTPALFVNRRSWIGRMKETRFMVYGNETMLRTAYWRVGLFVRVGPLGARTHTVAPVTEDDQEMSVVGETEPSVEV